MIFRCFRETWRAGIRSRMLTLLATAARDEKTRACRNPKPRADAVGEGEEGMEDAGRAGIRSRTLTRLTTTVKEWERPDVQGPETTRSRV